MAASVDDIISAQRAVHFPAELHKTLHKFMPWTPIINSTELPMDILDAAKAGRDNDVNSSCEIMCEGRFGMGRSAHCIILCIYSTCPRCLLVNE